MIFDSPDLPPAAGVLEEDGLSPSTGLPPAAHCPRSSSMASWTLIGSPPLNHSGVHSRQLTEAVFKGMMYKIFSLGIRLELERVFSAYACTPLMCSTVQVHLNMFAVTSAPVASPCSGIV